MIKQQNKGFTIIEVVLVLAIAGLIFLMVFIALPALQRGQRDQARKNDASVVASAANTYRSNNRGVLGGTSTSAITTAKLAQYVDNLNQYDKTATTEMFVVTTKPATSTPTASQIILYTERKCGTPPAPGAAFPLTTGSSREGAVVIRLENNGNTTNGWQLYCQDV